MKITRRIKKYFVMAAAVLAVVIGVQSVSVPIGIVNAVQESSVADIVADEVEEEIEYPDYGTYSMWRYKAMESAAEMKEIREDYTHVLLAWDDYLLPINTSTIQRGSKHSDWYGTIKLDNAVDGVYKDWYGMKDYPLTRYVSGNNIRISAVKASDYSVSVNSDVFYLSTEIEKKLNPGYTRYDCFYPVNDKGELLKFSYQYATQTLYHNPLEIQLVDCKHDSITGVFNVGSMLLNYAGYQYKSSEYPGVEYSGESITRFIDASDKGKGWFRIYGEGSSAMVVRGDKLYGYNDTGSPLKVYLGEEIKYTSIPDYTVTESFNITAGKYGDADGGTDKTDGIAIPPGVTMTVKKGAIVTVSGNLLNNGTILNYGTIVIQDGGCIAPFRPGSTPSSNGCGTIKCIGGDIVILKGGVLYAGMNDDMGADVPFYLDSNSTLINKGALVYGKMNLGQSARLELHEGSKTYGSWYAKELKNYNTLEGVKLSITWSELGCTREDVRRMKPYDRLMFFMDGIKNRYERAGQVIVRYSGVSAKDYSNRAEVDIDEMVVGTYVTLEQIAFPSAYNQKFIEKFGYYDNPQMRPLEKLGDTSLAGLCVNANATGKYAPHVYQVKDSFIKDSYFDDPNMDDSVRVEELIL